MLIWIGAALALIAVLLAYVPADQLAAAAEPFSFRDIGIYQQRRRHTTGDAIGSSMKLFCFAFCAGIGFIPLNRLMYAIVLALSLLCALSVVFDGVQDEPRWKQIVVILTVYAIGAFGLLGSLGLLNQSNVYFPAMEFITHLESGGVRHWMYPLLNYQPAYYVLQFVLMYMPLFMLWNLFRSYRLDEDFAQPNIWLFLVHYVLMIALYLLLALKGADGINFIYAVEYKAISAQLHPFSAESRL